jgi:hypothetical protein
MKARLLAFIIVKNGYLHSGANAALLPWIFYKTGWRRYTHQRVGDIEPLLLALEDDRDIVLTRDKWGKITAADLTSHYEISHAEFEAEMFTTPVELWAYITILRGKITQLQDHPKETAAALEMAIEAEHQRDEALLRVSVLEAEIANRTDTSDLERQIATLSPKLERVTAENVALTKRNTFLERQLAKQKEEALARKVATGKTLSRRGNEQKALERSLEVQQNVIDNLLRTLELLKELCLSNGIGPDQLKALDASFDTI